VHTKEANGVATIFPPEGNSGKQSARHGLSLALRTRSELEKAPGVGMSEGGVFANPAL